MGTKLKKRFSGVSPHRFKDNPLERAFAMAWQLVNDTSRAGMRDSLLSQVMTTEQRFIVELPAEDYKLAASVVQWLGSPVGQGFLQKVLLHTPAGRKFVKEELKVQPKPQV